MSRCPSIERVEQYFAGGLDSQAAGDVALHLERCSECRAILDRLRAQATQTRPAGADAATVKMPAGGEAAPMPARDDSPVGDVATPGRPHIPGYRIESEIHRGGQGVVYRAMQLNTHRVVAVKVLLQGPVASRRQRLRFQREVDLAARLRHANIVTIFDSGTTSEGWPFLVMEFLPGQTLEAYHALKKLTTRQAIQLMVPVCRAVAFAHEQGIVHRDLKPSNVLVDEAGTPHVLDFGLAKHPSESSDGEAVTVAGQFLGTYAYASPEHFAGDPNGVGARSDVYSLGITLYRLVCGRFPYPVEGPRSATERHVTQTEAKRPSTLRPDLRGDLDTILLKCLEKEPSRRYADAGELAADLERWLGGEPIEAKRDHWLYVARRKTRRWVSRHQGAAIAGGLLMSMALALGPVNSLVYVWLPLNEWYETALAAVMPPPDADSFGLTRVVGFDDVATMERLAAQEKLSDVSGTNLKSLRRLHGRLMERLVIARPRVVVWDISFKGETPYDLDFVAGVQRLEERGIPVVVAVHKWLLGGSGLPELSRTIAPAVRWGGMVVHTGKVPWRVEAVARRGRRQPLPSLALQSAAAWRYPDANMDIALEPEYESLTVQYWRPNEDLPQARGMLPQIDNVPIRYQAAQFDDPAYGIRQGDEIGHLPVTIPPDAVLKGSTIPYASVFGADESQIRDWFGGRIVIMADLRPGIDRHAHPDGRTVAGCYVHAAAIEQILSNTPRLLPYSAAGLSVSFLSLSVMFGFFAALFSFRSRTRWTVCVGIGVVTYLAAGFVLFLGFRYIWNPIVPLIALLLTSVIIVPIRRMTLLSN